MSKPGYIYILASRKNGTLYSGVTNDLRRRVREHKLNLTEGFTKRYSVHRLVYYEVYSDIRDAIIREKRLKKWNRLWKLRLIENYNPEWIDLYDKVNHSGGIIGLELKVPPHKITGSPPARG